jgi:hypothetical protein
MLRTKERFHKAVDKDDDVRGLWQEVENTTAGNQAPKREGNSSPFLFCILDIQRTKHCRDHQ